MSVYYFCILLIDMGIPPDTKIHLIPKEPCYRQFTFGTYFFNVNFSGSSCKLSDLINDSDLFDVTNFILDSLTILGDDLLFIYTKG